MTTDSSTENGYLLAGLNRANLEKMTVRYLRHGKPWQPDLLLVGLNGTRGVVKDYSKRSWLFRVTVGWLSASREEMAYGKLQGLSGVPQFLGRLDRYALVTEYIPGCNAAEVPPGVVGPEFFEKLEDMVDRIHQKGIVLCDLRHISNTVVSDKGDPYLLDFCTAFERGRAWNPLRRGLYSLFFQDDLLGVLKLKKHLAPQLFSLEDEVKLKKGVFLQGPAIRIRNFARKWLKKLLPRHGSVKK